MVGIFYELNLRDCAYKGYESTNKFETYIDKTHKLIPEFSLQ
jgi:hypothetical protein